MALSRCQNGNPDTRVKLRDATEPTRAVNTYKGKRMSNNFVLSGLSFKMICVCFYKMKSESARPGIPVDRDQDVWGH